MRCDVVSSALVLPVELALVELAIPKTNYKEDDNILLITVKIHFSPETSTLPVLQCVGKSLHLFGLNSERGQGSI